MKLIAIAVAALIIALTFGEANAAAAVANPAAVAADRSGEAALQLAMTRPVGRWSGYWRRGGSPSVRAVQRRLRAVGYRPGPIDGLFGPLTQRATRRFQRAAHLKTDGIAGPQTVKALVSSRPRQSGGGSSPGADVGRAPERTTHRGAPTGDHPRAKHTGAPPSSAQNGRAALREATSAPGTGTDWVKGVLIALAAAGVLVLGLALLMVGRGWSRSLVAVRPEFVAEGYRSDLGHFRGRLQAMSLSVSPWGRERTRYLVGDAPRRTAFWVEREQLRGIEFEPQRPRRSARAQGQATDPVQPAQLGPAAPPTRPVADRGVGEPAPVALGYVSSVNTGKRLDDPALRTQAEQLKELCRQRGWTLAQVVREGDANGSGERPALDYALERLRRGEVSCLVVGRLEQLCRSVGELGAIFEQLNGIGARLVSLEPQLDTATEAGAAAAQVLVAVSAWERARHAQRTRNGLAAARAKSVTTRPAVEDRPELKQRILALRADGMTLQAIADTLNAEGIPTLRGGSQWRPSSVQAAVGYKRPARGSLSEEGNAA